ncbi:MAG: hypothetical protein KBA66_07145 [Leptospiraceae bacterium]|nr:hypothetical protein [Leptospiraceae bacterium]
MNSWIKFAIVFFSLFFGITNSILPCSSDFYGRSPYPPFFIEGILGNLEKEEASDFDYPNDYLFREQNIIEWNIFFEKQVERDTISFWLYESKPSDIDEILFYRENKTPIKSDTVKQYGKSFFKYPKKTKAFFYYLGFARRNEAFAASSEHWADDSNTKLAPDKTKVNIQNQINGGISLYRNEKFQFIKERYIFQIVRLYFFKSEYKESIKFYNEHFSKIRLTDSMKWRTLGYVAASYKKQKEIGMANYLYALIYLNSPKQRYYAIADFHPIDDKDWEETLKLAKNKNEKIILWYLFGENFDALRAIKELYFLDPNSKYLTFSLIATIKSKSYLVFENGIQYKDYENPKLQKIIPLNDQALITTVNSIANQDRVKNRFAWKIAAAYLNYLSLNFKEGDKFLVSAFILKGNVEVFEKQYQITSLLGKLLRMETMADKSELTILYEMNFLFSKEESISNDFNLNFPREWVRGLLGVFYARKGELEKAEWIRSGIFKNRFSNLENTKRMVDFIEGNNHSPLMRVMLQNPMHSYDDYLLLLGIRYAQVGDLENSLKAFDKIKESYWNHKDQHYTERIFINDPFQIEIKDRYYHESNKKMLSIYNHKTFLQEMIRLKKEAETSPSNSSKKYFKLANAFYNMNYFGTSNFHFSRIHSFNTYNKWVDLDFKDNQKKEFYPELSNSLALKNYLLARENSKSKEFKAKMTFMAAKCEQNEWYLTEEHKPSACYWCDKEKTKDFQPGKYFQELRDIYSDTKYHSEIIKECSYYARYYGKKSEL